MICDTCQDDHQQKSNVSLIAFLCVFIFLLISGFIAILPYISGNWADWKQANCMPKDCFCEKPRGTLLQQPANTWSNMGFTAAGLIIIVQASRSDVRKDLFAFYSVIYGIADVLLGITSAFYHLSLTFVGQFVDNLGMFFVICWCITWNIARLNKHFAKTSIFFTLYFGQIFLAAYVNLYLPEIRRHAFGFSISMLFLSQIIVDVIIKPWNNGGIDYFYFLGAIISLAVAFGIWNVDLRRIYCEENSLLQGHAVWHLLDALGTYYLYLFYRSEVKKPESRLVQ